MRIKNVIFTDSLCVSEVAETKPYPKEKTDSV